MWWVRVAKRATLTIVSWVKHWCTVCCMAFLSCGIWDFDLRWSSLNKKQNILKELKTTYLRDQLTTTWIINHFIAQCIWKGLNVMDQWEHLTLKHDLNHELQWKQTSCDCSLCLSLPLRSPSFRLSTLASRAVLLILLLVDGWSGRLCPASGLTSGAFIMSSCSSSISSGESVDSRVSRSGSSLTWRPIWVRKLIFILDIVG